jgi:hypothetical protein
MVTTPGGDATSSPGRAAGTGVVLVATAGLGPACAPSPLWPARCLIAVGTVTSRETVLLYAGKVPDTDLTLCRLRATPERLTERIFRRGLGRGPVIPGPPPTTSKQHLAAMAAEAIRDAAEMDATDFADLSIDTDNHNVVQVAQHIRMRTNGWPQLTP